MHVFHRRKMVHITDFKRREARILADGPIRTMVEMRVEGWRYGGREITMTSRYILYAGHGDVQVENRIEGDFRGLVFTTGVMKMAESEVCKNDNVIAAFGRDFPENDTVKWERESVGWLSPCRRGRSSRRPTTRPATSSSSRPMPADGSTTRSR